MLRRLNFSLWYYFHPPWDSGISPPELLDFIAQHVPGRAIDLGCGTGTNVITLAQHGWQVTGIDFAPRAIQIARRKLARAGVDAEVFVGDATQLSGITGPYDLALDMGCYHGIPDRAGYLTQLHRVLARGASWLLYAIWRAPTASSGPGLSGGDISLIESSGFGLVSRTDGFDRRSRSSSWFLYQRE